MSRTTAAIAYRLGFAALSLTAVLVQLFAVQVAKGYSVVNFFSYFTNLSNIVLSVVFIVSAIRLIRGRTDPSDSDVAIRGGAVVYIVFVGLVFNFLLVDGDVGEIIPWVNFVVHLLVPAAGLLDWIIWAPRRMLPLQVALWWMVWPAVYSIVAVVRGAVDGFYPYPFFDPAASGEYAGVALWCLVLVIAFFVLALLVRWIGNVRHSRSSGAA